jgi:hypothetical protein
MIDANINIKKDEISIEDKKKKPSWRGNHPLRSQIIC